MTPKPHPLREISAMAGAFVGILVGAGFSSGQEIIQFFSGYGRMGLIGCIVTGLGFLTLPVLFSVMGYRMQAASHKEVVRTIMGQWLWHLFDILVTFFQFAYTVVMLGALSNAAAPSINWSWTNERYPGRITDRIPAHH